MADFLSFKLAVSKQFDLMKQHSLFRMAVTKEALWDTYLGSFPEGTNPIFKERREHDCQCCRSFIRAVGGLVAIIDGKIVSIWDVKTEGEYQVVADALSALVKSAPIENIFLHTETQAGIDKNFQDTGEGIKTWNHFYIKLPTANICKGVDIGTRLGESRSAKDVFARALAELTLDSVDTVLELIAQNSLYRGEEHKFVVDSFRKLKVAYGELTTDLQRDIFCWSSAAPGSVKHIRNSAIGTLLVDLSEGMDLDVAVKVFEFKVAGPNYKRPTALVTKAMVEKAQKAIEELGLTSALERRYATLQDITVNNILFADRDAKKVIQGGVFAEISSGIAEKPQSFDKVEEIPVDVFLSSVMPAAKSVEVMLENRHEANLVSLIAPVDPEAKNMFKWPNKFSWSYTGEMADSIKERVKKAGGKIEGDLCCRLAWDYTDDLDFHMLEPKGGTHIYFGNRRSKSLCGGILDVDANGGDGIMPNPVENIYYADKRTMKEGSYVLNVNNYSRRSSGVGFEVEIEFDGKILNFVYDKVLKTGDTVRVAEIRYSKKDGFSIVNSLPSSQTVKNMWGLSTQSFHKVSALMMSPNYWDDKTVGNKHLFFMLDGCLNDGRARGFFNEFLAEELTPHRKVLEVVGSKMKTEKSQNQLSGIGFSSTQRNHVLCKVEGKFTRVVKVVF